mgnify:CR=1 FL=1|tara:strand:+ start:1270 stop:1479 length:210 start_codon:yes stop_codon:yes gene_type:complete
MTKVIPLEIVLNKKNLNDLRKSLDQINDLWNKHNDKMSEEDKRKLFKIVKDGYENIKKSSIKLKKNPIT